VIKLPQTVQAGFEISGMHNVRDCTAVNTTGKKKRKKKKVKK